MLYIWMNLENVVPSERSQTQTIMDYIIKWVNVVRRHKLPVINKSWECNIHHGNYSLKKKKIPVDKVQCCQSSWILWENTQKGGICREEIP